MSKLGKKRVGLYFHSSLCYSCKVLHEDTKMRTWLTSLLADFIVLRLTATSCHSRFVTSSSMQSAPLYHMWRCPCNYTRTKDHHDGWSTLSTESLQQRWWFTAAQKHSCAFSPKWRNSLYWIIGLRSRRGTILFYSSNFASIYACTSRTFLLQVVHTYSICTIYIYLHFTFVVLGKRRHNNGSSTQCNAVLQCLFFKLTGSISKSET